MSHTPHCCPVCAGTGLVSVPPGIPGDLESFTTASLGPWECRPCAGTGIIWSGGAAIRQATGGDNG